ncbi:sulfotransferase family protein [Microbulbifer sp. SA54]|uniref:sulfotransferase family protein n=1 Tax=Microbulbifer sp. SA54 TaxID=3401577 RepID=UPI003AAC1563
MKTMHYPDFFLIGAMKAGTTSLYHMLEHHPKIFLSYPKEPEYFSEKFLQEGAESWYQSLFQNSDPDSLLGECSTGYSRSVCYPYVAERIQSVKPSARIIYLLRHPVERCWSHYLHRMNEHAMAGEPVLEFCDAIEAYPEILDASRYFKQISNFTTLFDRSQIHIILFDDLRNSAESTMNRLYDFLGLPHIGVASLIHANRAGDQTGRRHFKSVLNNFKKSIMGKVLKIIFPRQFLRWLSKQTSRNKYVIYIAKNIHKTVDLPKQPDSDTRQKLLAYFYDETVALEQWLGRELPPSWKV